MWTLKLALACFALCCLTKVLAGISCADTVDRHFQITSRIGKSPVAASAMGIGKALEGKLETESLAKIIGTPGEASGAVYKITIGRPDIKMVEMGAPINARMGLHTWAAFSGSDADAVVAGDVAMLDREVQPSLRHFARMASTSWRCTIT